MPEATMHKDCDRRFRFARSGEPGRSRFRVVYLRPNLDAARRTANSGAVSRCPIPDIRSESATVVLSSGSRERLLDTLEQQRTLAWSRPTAAAIETRRRTIARCAFEMCFEGLQ